MSPLAQAVVNQLTLPVKDRKLIDEGNVLREMADVHCFDITDVVPIIDDMIEARAIKDLSAEFLFQPAERTWIELHEGTGRIGVLLVEKGDLREWWFTIATGSVLHSQKLGRFGWCWQDVDPLGQRSDTPFDEAQLKHTFELVLIALAIINTPRLIGRKQHMPHRGLERKLAKQKAIVGSFPLHAWTELKLSVSAMMRQADGREHEAHYTGEKCLHFCRAHLRVRNGRLEQVRAHWRGNAAIGIKRTRYKLAA